MIYVYGIVDSPRPDVAGLPGLSDRPLEVHACESFGAAFSRHDSERPAATADNVWRHEQVVESLMDRHAVLPARFGTIFRDEPKLDAALREHGDRIVHGLDRVRGHVELGLRVLWKSDQSPLIPAVAPPESSGREYMMARLADEQRRREERRRAEEVAGRLHAPLASLAADSTRRLLATPGMVLSAAYLVPRGRTDDFRRAVEQLGENHPHLRLLCTGPWPPYHFVPSLADVAEVKT
jgi:hypothetical protein